MTFLINPAARTEEQHRKNQIPGISPSSMRFCYGPRCRNGSGQSRSIQQFRNAAGKEVFKYCRRCRGVE